ncbi:aldehyde oxidase [Candidatus Uabimicrobium amorphum]|uniref:Aldehyde oxidase n=2 Tax=Uabimicrobium amorphum TaxID=2596890 RepID=A0A5S9IM59_UABAM|nr:xanthine dehydrogenase family protein molybdopterin-binding subunit [Candidatus Uabimicrobium amorphum]BBM83986.1 aldehyde oxidase [Candidatus Uabimicrobium amorphum]
MRIINGMTRRSFLKTSAAVLGGLVIGFQLPSSGRRIEAKSKWASADIANAFLRIDEDGSITIMVNHSEMGQGVYTSLPMIVAEELDCDWNDVRIEPAPVNMVYSHTTFGSQMTGGSSSVWTEWERLRLVGATGKAMLIAAAAKTWEVAAESCRAENSVVYHDASKRQLTYGQLTKQASQMSTPKQVSLKDPKDFKIIGTPVKRLDTPEKTNGQAVFGIDVNLPGMLTAVVRRSPVFGGKVKSFSADKAKAIKGVQSVIQISSGVAVIADDFWTAKIGAQAVEIVWDEGPDANLSTQQQSEQYAALANTPGAVARKKGNITTAMDVSAKKLEAVYEVPYLAHAPMEPLNCVADVRKDGCDVWTGTQLQTAEHATAKAITGLPAEKVKIHTTLLGGGFGRRAVPDCHFVSEAVQISKAIQKPVKVVWTREDDIQGGWYRPRYYHKLSAGINDDKKPIAWKHTIVGQSITAGTPFEAFMVRHGVDVTSVEGAENLPYAIPNVLVDLHSPRHKVPVLWWRAVGGTHNAFAVECFLDEVAHAAGKDPYEFRRELLASEPRHLKALELAISKSNWGKPLPKGHGRGLAVHSCFGSFVAQVAEVSVSKEGKVKVHNVVCAVDCGPIVNPNTIDAQIEGGIAFGLAAALHGEVTLKNGRAEQSNFYDYKVLRMDEMPKVETHIVPSTDKMGGIGEVAVPPIAPAVVNAIFDATGKRVRQLPISSEDLRS